MIPFTKWIIEWHCWIHLFYQSWNNCITDTVKYASMQAFFLVCVILEWDFSHDKLFSLYFVLYFVLILTWCRYFFNLSNTILPMIKTLYALAQFFFKYPGVMGSNVGAMYFLNDIHKSIKIRWIYINILICRKTIIQKNKGIGSKCATDILSQKVIK